MSQFCSSFQESFDCNVLTLSPLNKLLSAKFLVCFTIQSASMLLKVGKNTVCVSNSLDLGETPSYSGSKLFAYGNTGVLTVLNISKLKINRNRTATVL